MSTATLTAQSDHASSTWANKTGVTYFGDISDSNDATYAYGTDNSETVDQWWLECEFTDMPTALAITSVTIHIRARNGVGLVGTNHVAGRVKSAGTSYNAASQATTGSFVEYTQSYAVDPATSAPWTPSGVNAARFGAWYDVTGFASPGPRISPEIAKVWVTVEYVPLPPDQGATRDAASRKLFLRRMPQQYPNLTGGLWLLDLAHHSQVDLFHRFGIAESGRGWERDRWKRGLMTVRDVSVDPMTNIVTLRFKNDRRIRCWMYDSGWAKQGGPAKNGLMRFTNGATWTFTRASEATFVDVSGDTVTVQPNVEAYAAQGQEFLAAAGARAVDRGYYSNNTGARTWCAQQMSARFEVTPDWTGGSAPATFMRVAFVSHDANNYADVYYNDSIRRWIFAQNVAGVLNAAEVDHSPIAGTRYVIGVRCTGPRGELGLAPYTADIFASGVKGTSVTHAGPMTEAGTSTFDIGTSAGVTPFRGRIRRRISRQIVLTDIEMARSF